MVGVSHWTMQCLPVSCRSNTGQTQKPAPFQGLAFMQPFEVCPCKRHVQIAKTWEEGVLFLYYSKHSKHNTIETSEPTKCIMVCMPLFVSLVCRLLKLALEMVQVGKLQDLLGQAWSSLSSISAFVRVFFTVMPSWESWVTSHRDLATLVLAAGLNQSKPLAPANPRDPPCPHVSTSFKEHKTHQNSIPQSRTIFLRGASRLPLNDPLHDPGWYLTPLEIQRPDLEGGVAGAVSSYMK